MQKEKGHNQKAPKAKKKLIKWGMRKSSIITIQSMITINTNSQHTLKTNSKKSTISTTKDKCLMENETAVADHKPPNKSTRAIG